MEALEHLVVGAYREDAELLPGLEALLGGECRDGVVLRRYSP